jgi:hypothetical protein
MLDLETQLDRYGEFLDEVALAESAARPVASPRALPVSPQPPRRRPVAAAVLLVVVAIAVGVLLVLRSTGSTGPKSIEAGGGPSDTVVDTNPPPAGTPPNWKTVQYDGIQVSVPPSWAVSTGDECPGRRRSILVGAGRSSGCPAPRSGAAWAWLARAGSRTLAERRGCAPLTLNGVPACLLDVAGEPSVTFTSGTGAALVTSPSASRNGIPGTTVSRIRDSLRYATEWESAAIADEQPLVIARQAADAYARGDCKELARVTDRSYAQQCPEAVVIVVPDGTLPLPAESQLAGPNQARAAARVTYNRTYAYDVELRHEWSVAEQRGLWRVTAVDAVDPATPLPTFAQPSRPECGRVLDLSGKDAGCARIQRDLDPQRRITQLQRYGGEPVYKSSKSSTVVGVFVSNLGYVPNRLLGRVDEIKACDAANRLHRLDPGQPPLSEACRVLLHDWGMTDSQIDASG